MKKRRKNGFTLIEVLAVIIMIAILGGIAIPNVISTINAGKKAGEDILIKNIKTAAQQLYEEVEYAGSELYDYTKDGNQTTKITITEDNTITIHLQALASNGFISSSGEEIKEIKNPKTNENLGNCIIKIAKTVSTDYEVTYTITKEDNQAICPTY